MVKSKGFKPEQNSHISKGYKNRAGYNKTRNPQKGNKNKQKLVRHQDWSTKTGWMEAVNTQDRKGFTIVKGRKGDIHEMVHRPSFINSTAQKEWNSIRDTTIDALGRDYAEGIDIMMGKAKTKKVRELDLMTQVMEKQVEENEIMQKYVDIGWSLQDAWWGMKVDMEVKDQVLKQQHLQRLSAAAKKDWYKNQCSTKKAKKTIQSWEACKQLAIEETWDKIVEEKEVQANTRRWEKKAKKHQRKKNRKEKKMHIFNIGNEKEVHQNEDKNKKEEYWLGDTGASCHVTYDDNKMMSFQSCDKDKVLVADKRRCAVEKKGDLILKPINDQSEIILKGVRVVKKMGKHIISIGKLLADGGKLKGSGKIMEVFYQGKKLTFRQRAIDGLYYIQVKRINKMTYDRCYEITTNEGWELVGKNNKKHWKKMNRNEAHRKWGHQHYDQMNWMANKCRIHLQGKVGECAGCSLVKCRAKANAGTTKTKATENGMRLFVDTTGPLPKSRGGMKYWQVAVDDKSDYSWTNFSATKTHMTEFVDKLVTQIKGRGLNVLYLRCDNAGEHQTELRDLCVREGITIEYTAPYTPQQNGRAEKKIYVIWQRALTMMVHAKFTASTQNRFWAEAVACATYLENLTIKSGRIMSATEAWTGNDVHKWMMKLIEFGRIGVVPARKKLKKKMSEKGKTAMMVGYASNHGAGTYRLYNPHTNRIVLSRDVKWADFKPRKLEKEMVEMFEPGIENDDTEEQLMEKETENDTDETSVETMESSIVSRMEDMYSAETESTSLEYLTKRGKCNDAALKGNKYYIKDKDDVIDGSDSDYNSSNDETESVSKDNDEESCMSSLDSRGISRTTISKPMMKKTVKKNRSVNNQRNETPPPIVKIRSKGKKTPSKKKGEASGQSQRVTRAKAGMKLRSGRKKNNNDEVIRRVTGDVTPKRVTIHEEKNQVYNMEEGDEKLENM